MATNLAEFVAGVIGVSMLTHLPMFPRMLITAAITYALLQFGKRGFRPLELAFAALVGVIALSYLAGLLIAPVHWLSVVRHTFTPAVPDSNALTISVGIIGATVMPHVLFLHSGLTQNRMTPRNEHERCKPLRFSNIEVVVALGVAGLINMAMLIMASSAFHAGHTDIASVETAWHTLTPPLGGAAAGLFLAALIASGVSSPRYISMYMQGRLPVDRLLTGRLALGDINHGFDLHHDGAAIRLMVEFPSNYRGSEPNSCKVAAR